MIKVRLLLLLSVLPLFIMTCTAQSYKFYYSNGVKFLKANHDSLRNPFTGGMNAPQFSNIDLNGDGVKDLFVFDRSANKGLTFVYTAKGYVHAPQYESLFPYMTNWCQLKDYNGDGKPDIFTQVSTNVDDLVYPDEIIWDPVNTIRILKNTTISSSRLRFKQLNNFATDTGYLDWGRSAIGINVTDIAGIDDLDNDGDVDILTLPNTTPVPTFYENYMINKHDLPYDPDSMSFIFRDQCWGYIQYTANPYRNEFDLGVSRELIPSCFKQMYEKKGMDMKSTILLIDYNGDGVKDMVYGDGQFKNLLLLVNGKNQNSLGRDSIISQDTMFPSNTVPAQFIIYPVGYYVDIDGDGLNELIVTTNEPVAAKSVNNVWVYSNTGTNDKPVFQYEGNNFFGYEESIDLGTRSAPVLVDIDNDGDDDLVVGTNGDYEQTKNMKDRLVLYDNIGKVNGRSVFSLKDDNLFGLSDSSILMLHPTFADLNGDQKKDLLIGDANGYVHYYSNTSNGTNYSVQLQTHKLGNIDAGTNAAPTFADLDNDGDLDMVIGNREGILKYYANTGTSAVPQFASGVTIDSFGKVMVRDQTVTLFGPYYQSYGNASPIFYDLDNDGKQELVVGSEGGKVFVYSNISLTPGAIFTKQDNLFVDYSDSLNPRSLRFGATAVPALGSLDEDDKPDMIVGNILGGLSFYASINDKPHVGVRDLQKAENHFVLYPNPSRDVINLDHSNIHDDGIYKIYNQMGQIVMKGTINHYYSECMLNVNNLPLGFYFIQISGSDYHETIKFVKD